MTAQTAIHAVVFDLDDTLYPERQYVFSGYCAVAGLLRRQLGPGHPFVAANPPAEAWLWNRFLRTIAPQGPPAADRGGAFDAMNEQFNLGLSSERVGQLVDAYRRHMPDIQPYEGIAHTLSVLAGERRLGILSDGYQPGQTMKLEAINLRRFFDAVVFTEDLGRDKWKPSPIPFQRIAERLEVSPSACAYVGDNPSKDFLAPNMLGWKTIQWLRPGQLHSRQTAPAGGEAMHVVRDAGELLAALRA